ncbi:ras-related protein Rab-7L1-like [Asterias rubens]|uniref:ras-related protein Rab-7L1-like n=1 Tax=Asterias rubens TaxID=7604 RepID=UPI001454EB95|nr:ras-related protein Rab-7L1-like [Asterias rubens]
MGEHEHFLGWGYQVCQQYYSQVSADSERANKCILTTNQSAHNFFKVPQVCTYFEGRERFCSLTRVYFKEASACVIMFDVTSIKSFQHVVTWKNLVDSTVSLRDRSPIPFLLLGNKSDLDEHKVSDEEIKAMSEDHNFVGWSKISVKDNYNLEESMMLLVEEVVARLQPRVAEFTIDDGRIKLPHTYNKQSKSLPNAV